MKLIRSGLIFLLLLPFGRAAAQDQQASQDQQSDSPAEAARRAREQKKDQAKAAKVWDNDNVPAAGGVNVVGQSPTPSSDSANPQEPAQGAAAAPAEEASKSSSSPKDAAALQGELASAKARLDSLKTDLDLLQRKFALDSQTYLSNPNHSSDTAGADALTDEKSQIEAKLAEVDAAQKKVDELSAKAQESSASTDTSSTKPQ